MEKEMAIFLRDNRVSIGSSLDGPRDGNDLIRTRKEGGTYDIIMEKMNLFKEIGYPLDAITITMNDLNIDSIDENFVLFLKSLGIVALATDVDLVNVENCNKDVDFYVGKLLSLYHLFAKHGIINTGSWSLIYSKLVKQENDDPMTLCLAQSGGLLSVNPEGNIFLCGYSVTKVGRLESIQDMFTTNSLYTNLIASRLPGNQEKCFGCEIEGICSGQCLITHEFNPDRSDPNNKIDFLCELFKKCTSNMLDIKLVSELSTI